MRRLLLCADDFALHPLVDDAVLQLAQAGRLSATSCMATSPRWHEAAALLRPWRGRLQVGLHFNLTESHGSAHPARGLKAVIAGAYLHRSTPAQWRAAWRAQLDAFENAWGAAPDFIDGHQHVHQLPGARQALCAELQARYAGSALPWVRSTVPAGGLWRDPKAAVIALLGGYAARRALRRGGVAVNQGFGGVYGFDASTPAQYGAQMARWLAQMADGGLVMCHPANAVVAGDAIGAQRPVEFAYLMSEAFGALLAQQGWQIHQGLEKGCTAAKQR